MVVHGLIVAGSAAVQANFNRSYTIDEPFDTLFPGAAGIVWRGSDTWQMSNQSRDVYATGELQSRPAPGDTFGLRVVKDGFDTVYGRTVVPDSFRIIFPRAGDTVTMSDSMVWSRSRGCAGYYMSIQSVERGDTFYYSLAIPNDTTGENFDSSKFRLPQMVFLYLYETGRHTLRVHALDTNYFDWVRAGGFGGGASETTRLSGGFGVFGSAVGDSVEVYVAADTAGNDASRSPVPELRRQKSGVARPERFGEGRPRLD